jgi:hypothetical protein
MLREYITGADNRALRAIYIKAFKSEDAGTNPDSLVEFDADNKAIELAVVSITGANLEGDTLVEKVLSLPLADFNEVIAQVKDIVEGKKKLES